MSQPSLPPTPLIGSVKSKRRPSNFSSEICCTAWSTNSCFTFGLWYAGTAPHGVSRCSNFPGSLDQLKYGFCAPPRFHRPLLSPCTWLYTTSEMTFSPRPCASSMNRLSASSPLTHLPVSSSKPNELSAARLFTPR